MVDEGGDGTADLERVGAHAPFDEGLVERCRAYAGDLLQMLYVFVNDKATAEDLVQEAFIRVLRAWARLRHGAGTRTCLRTTAFNLARWGFRRRMVSLRHRPAGPGHAASPEADVVLREE